MTSPDQRQRQDRYRDHRAVGHRVPPSFGATPPRPVTPPPPTACEWMRWHAFELLLVGGPVVLGVWVSVWLVLLAVPAAGLWAAHERRVSRQHRAQLQPSRRAALTDPNATTTTTTVSANSGVTSKEGDR